MRKFDLTLGGEKIVVTQDVDGKFIIPDIVRESLKLGSALKPAWEPICLARKPLIGTVAANVLEHGTGAINIDGCRVPGEPWKAHSATGLGSVKFFSEGDTPIIDKAPHDLGRWPTNLVHDGSDEVIAAFPDAKAAYGNDESARSKTAEKKFSNGDHNTYGVGLNTKPCGSLYTDNGSAARFFYSAKADSDDRLGSKHPTVKPVDLMQWLVRLVTPKGGLVLDPFAGTGTTAEACCREGMRCMLVERETEYQADIRRRMALVLGGPEERRRESIKAKNFPVDHGPLFAEAAE
jgi:site-specific DNA-methyltransferase (adenine-specific)